MLVIGLTGGIASGKTTISNIFESFGIPVIDTDILSRNLLDVGQPGYEKVVSKLGPSILLKNRDINRRDLRRLVFSDEALKTWLESILHPMIYSKVRHQIQENKNASYILVVVPLLFESNFMTLVDRILVVDCPRFTQVRRLVARDGIDEALANSMLDQQWSNDDRLKQADDIIHNAKNENLVKQVQSLHKKYTQLTTDSNTR